MPKAGGQHHCKWWHNEAHKTSKVAPLTRRQRNSLNYWKGSEARREEEQERAEVRRELGLLAEELARESQQVWSSTSRPDLASLAECEALLDQALECDAQPAYFSWRAELRRRQGGRLEEALADSIKWRKRTMMEGGKGRAQLMVLNIQLARRDIARAEAALEKAVRKGWFSREQEEEARDRIRQTRLELSSRSTSSELASSQEVRRRRSQERARRKEIKEQMMLTD